MTTDRPEAPDQILVLTDFSETSRAAVDWAVALAPAGIVPGAGPSCSGNRSVPDIAALSEVGVRREAGFGIFIAPRDSERRQGRRGRRAPIRPLSAAAHSAQAA